MCFKLFKIHLMCTHPFNLLHCVIPSDTLIASFPPASTCFNIPMATIFYIFLCGTFQDLLSLSLPLTTLQANHNAASDNTGQSQWRFYPNTTIYRSVSNQASWLLSIRSWLWPRSGNGSVWWPRSGRVSAW